MITILFIHQSAELYGSDKTLFFLVKGLVKQNIRPIVVLPNEGPLAILLREANIELFISPVIKVSRTLFSFRNILKIPFLIISSVYKLNRLLAQESIDVVHSNTLAVLAGAFYAKWKGINHIWHVHEIIENPRIVNKTYRFLVNYFSKKVVFNSIAALNSLVEGSSKLKAKSLVIYNGIEKPDKSYTIDEIDIFKAKQLNLKPDSIIIGIVGRISRWKGHSLLLDAFEKLQKENPTLILLIVGSPPPNQEYYLSNLQNQIRLKELEEEVQIHGFTSEIWKFWSAIDIAVVPSTEPEPFGLVAVEAMYLAKPVVAAKHGGLLEIIEHGNNGLLFEPNNEHDLYEKLKLLIDNPTLRNSIAQSGQNSSFERFTVEQYVLKFVDIYTKTSKHV